MPHPKYWIAAFRLRTLPLSLSTIFAGSYAAALHGFFRWDVLILASLTTLFLQILSNIANDYGDGVAGTDKYRQGELRMVQSGLISRSQMLTMIVILAVLSLMTGIALLVKALPGIFSLKGILFLLFGVFSIAAAINYTIGRNPYGYKGWGDFFVYVFFGLLGVYGSYYLHSGVFSFNVWLLASALGLLSTAVLNVNNLRDEQSDRAAGKRSLVVIWGHQFGVRYHVVICSLAWMQFLLFVYLNYTHWIEWLFVIILPFFGKHIHNILTSDKPHDIEPELKRLSLATFFTVVLMIVGYLLSMIF